MATEVEKLQKQIVELSAKKAHFEYETRARPQQRRERTASANATRCWPRSPRATVARERR